MSHPKSPTSTQPQHGHGHTTCTHTPPLLRACLSRPKADDDDDTPCRTPRPKHIYREPSYRSRATGAMFGPRFNGAKLKGVLSLLCPNAV